MKYQILVNGRVLKDFECGKDEAFNKFHSLCDLVGSIKEEPYTIALGGGPGVLVCGIIRDNVIQLREAV